MKILFAILLLELILTSESLRLPSNLQMSGASNVYWNTNLKAKLFRISALTNRGETASRAQQEEVQEIISSLETENPSIDSDSPQFTIRGEWDLVYTDSQLFMGSPFFLFVRELFGSNFEQAQDTFKLHRRATSTGRIEAVRQVITDKELRSEVELNVGVIPGPPFSLTGTVVSSADIEYEDKFTVKVTFRDTVVRESPFSFILDWLPPPPIKQLYKAINNKKPLPASILTTYYLDDDMRITRTLDDTVFVYTRSDNGGDRGTVDESTNWDGDSNEETVKKDGEVIYFTSPEAGE